MQLKILRRYKPNRLGEVFSVCLKENNISSHRKDLVNLIGSEFKVEEDNYILRGLEAFWDYEDKAKDDKVIFVLYKVL